MIIAEIIGTLLLLVLFVLMIARAVGKGAQVAQGLARVDAEAGQALAKLAPGKKALREVVARGESANPDGAQGRGALAVFDDKLAFCKVGGGTPWQMPLVEIGDVQQIRALSAMDQGEDMVDAQADYVVKVSWNGGSATFAVADPESLVSDLAKARMPAA